MAALDANGIPTVAPLILDGTYIGTAATLATILQRPGYIGGITVNRRAASGAIIVYDSVGTTASVLGSIVLGTQTNTDGPFYPFNIRTKNGLTVNCPADVGITVSFGV